MHAVLPLLLKTDFPPIARRGLDTLQVNLGYVCNQTCQHCHVAAGPNRTESMDAQTVDAVIDALSACRVGLLDLTGGAPELNPHFRRLVVAAREAGAIHRHIKARKGEIGFVTEVSMDETDSPQTPRELLVILCLLADERVPLDTIAPKFTGRFNKGVDYVGNLVAFEREFNDDLAVLAHASATYGLPAGLKLSVHSGSDKFSLYPVIRRALERTGAPANGRGLQIKLIGGATILDKMGSFNIGKRNVLGIKRLLWQYGLGAVAEDVGGELSRTVRVEVPSGLVRISSPGLPVWQV
jgi:hypothetical protein